VVFADTNGNGIADTGEATLSGFAVKLYRNVSGTTKLISTATTGTTGYKFSNLAAGTYYVYVTNQPTKYQPTGKSTSFYQINLTVGGNSTKDNFGEQPPHSATTTFTARTWSAKLGVTFDAYSGIATGASGDWAEYKTIDFGTGLLKTFKAALASKATFVGSIQVRLDSPTGTLIGTLKVAHTGAWNNYTYESTAITKVTGIHNVYLVFVGGANIANVKSFTFA